MVQIQQGNISDNPNATAETFSWQTNPDLLGNKSKRLLEGSEKFFKKGLISISNTSLFNMFNGYSTELDRISSNFFNCN